MTAYPEWYVHRLAALKEPETLGADGRPSLYRMVDDLYNRSECSQELYESLSPGCVMRKFRGEAFGNVSWPVPTLEVDWISFGVLRLPSSIHAHRPGWTSELVLMHHVSCVDGMHLTEKPIFNFFIGGPKPEPDFLPAIRDALADLHLLHMGGSFKLNETPHYWERYEALHQRAADRIREAGARLLYPDFARWTSLACEPAEPPASDAPPRACKL